jgi:glutamate racemase
MNIGFFDSGLGGLTILKAVANALPQYDYMYYGDTANLPYGDKTEAQIYEYSKAAITELFSKDCLLVIVACNTASSETLRRLQDTFLPAEYPDRKILGVIIPTIEELVAINPQRALLLATKRTVESGKYQKELSKYKDMSIELASLATPELVPLIELGEIEAAVTAAITLIEREAREGDVVLLGCTHYTMLKSALREYFKSKLTIISQDEVIPKKITEYLSNHPEIETKLAGTGKRSIILTKHRPDYDFVTAQFLGGAYLPDEEE